MSSLVVQVVTVDDVKEHPNADRLALAVVGGWQCVVAKGEWAKGDRAVFFPPDTILPESVSDQFGVTQYLSKGRIKHTRLRGEPSFGLVVKPDTDWPVGTDVAAYYGATKYEPPVRQVQGAPRDRAAEHPKFSRYTEIENLRHHPHVFDDGELVIVTEKIHGANCRIGVIDGKIVAGSRRLQRDGFENGFEDATYWTPFIHYEGVRRFLEGFIEPQRWWERLLRRSKKSKTVIIYGEVFGPSIQSFDYGLHNASLDFRAFDIMVDGAYLNWSDVVRKCDAFEIPHVPELDVVAYNIDVIRRYAEGKNAVGGHHIREGVVVRPATERRDPRVGRLIMKYVSDAYLLKEKKTDYAEV